MMRLLDPAENDVKNDLNGPESGRPEKRDPTGCWTDKVSMLMEHYVSYLSDISGLEQFLEAMLFGGAHRNCAAI